MKFFKGQIQKITLDNDRVLKIHWSSICTSIWLMKWANSTTTSSLGLSSFCHTPPAAKIARSEINASHNYTRTSMQANSSSDTAPWSPTSHRRLTSTSTFGSLIVKTSSYRGTLALKYSQDPQTSSKVIHKLSCLSSMQGCFRWPICCCLTATSSLKFISPIKSWSFSKCCTT